MPRGDTFQLKLKGQFLTDPSWLPGALHTDLAVDVVSLRPDKTGPTTAVVRLKNNQQSAPKAGQAVTAARAFAPPGVDPPSATIESVEYIGNSFSPTMAQQWLDSPESRPVKVAGAIALIAVTAALSMRIKP